MSLAFLMGMARFNVPTAFLILLGAMAFAGSLTGCYTQLYSRGYAERAAANYPEYSRAPRAPADTLAPDSAALAQEDSLRRIDSLYASNEAGRGGSGSGSVIVNNYYQESPYYRGYLIQDWNYPTLTFGIYSSRYRDYYGPYWWNDPWYRTGGGYHRGYYGNRGSRGNHGNNGGYDPPAGGGAGPYTSDKRIFTPAPDRELRKGRRADPAQPPAPKSGSDNGSSSGSSSGTSTGSSSGSSSGSKSESGSSDKDDHPPVNKGKRR